MIGGTGAFIVVAEGFGSFAAAIRKKLIFEIAGVLPPDGTAVVRETPRKIRSVAPGLRLAAWPSGARRGMGFPPGLLHLAERAPPPCDIGERRLEQRRRTWDDY